MNAGAELHVMYVCIGCILSKSTAERNGRRSGRALWDALVSEAARLGGAAVHLEPVACLSVCRDACAVALTAPHKYTYTFGWVEPTTAAAADLLGMASLYAQSPTGHVDRRARPRFARRLISRVPPPDCDPDRDDDASNPRMAAQVPKPPRA
jgi:predicted metal-binding protein